MKCKRIVQESKLKKASGNLRGKTINKLFVIISLHYLLFVLNKFEKKKKNQMEFSIQFFFYILPTTSHTLWFFKFQCIFPFHYLLPRIIKPWKHSVYFNKTGHLHSTVMMCDKRNRVVLLTAEDTPRINHHLICLWLIPKASLPIMQNYRLQRLLCQHVWQFSFLTASHTK